jgi:glycosyltransferase involved in cell wall biosynthesis
VVVPSRNEEKFIRQCLDSIIDNDYPKDCLELLVVDGMSEDGTWMIIREYAQRHSFVRGLRNPKLTTPAALNLGVRNSTGTIIIRVDAHALISPDYLRLCVQNLLATGAENVGGAMRTVPQRPGYVASAIAAGISHPFGVGNSRFRAPTPEPAWVDTVFGGCYRKELFERIGLFNEQLTRGQDMEFNQRLSRCGGKILLDPQIKSQYFASADLRSCWRHNFHDGVWALLPFAFSETVPIRWRHSVPLIFVTAVLALAGLAFRFASCRAALLAILCAYLIASLLSSWQIALRNKDWHYLMLMPLVFAVRHFAYGFGSLWGLSKLLGKMLRRQPTASNEM